MSDLRERENRERWLHEEIRIRQKESADEASKSGKIHDELQRKIEEELNNSRRVQEDLQRKIEAAMRELPTVQADIRKIRDEELRRQSATSSK